MVNKEKHQILFFFFFQLKSVASQEGTSSDKTEIAVANMHIITFT